MTALLVIVQVRNDHHEHLGMLSKYSETEKFRLLISKESKKRSLKTISLQMVDVAGPFLIKIVKK